MNRLNKILLVVLVVQIAIAVLVLSQGGGDKPARPQPLLAGFDAAKVTSLELSPARDPAAAPSPTDRPIALAKRGEGWVVTSSQDYPAQQTPVTELLTKLGGLLRAQPVASSVARHKQLGVADDAYERKVVLTLEGKPVTLYVGRPIGGRQTAVRLGDRPDVYAVSGLNSWSIDPQLRTWVDGAYASVAQGQIGKVLVQRPDGGLQLEHDGAQWKPLAVDGAPIKIAAGEAVEQAAIDEVLGQLSRVELVDVAPPAPPPEPALATITVWTKPAAPAPADPAAPAAPAAPGTDPAAPATPPAAPAPAPAASEASEVSSAPAFVLTVAAGPAGSSQYWVRKQGDTRAVLVDESRLRATVELARDKVVKKPSAAPAPAAPAAGSSPADLPPGLPLPPGSE